MTPSAEGADEIKLTLGYYLLISCMPVVSRCGLWEGVELCPKARETFCNREREDIGCQNLNTTKAFV